MVPCASSRTRRRRGLDRHPPQRAQLWLARQALSAKHPDKALSLYRVCLALLPDPVPTDLLQQMSGDLGNAGLLAELFHLSERRLDAAAHISMPATI